MKNVRVTPNLEPAKGAEVPFDPFAGPLLEHFPNNSSSFPDEKDVHVGGGEKTRTPLGADLQKGQKPLLLGVALIQQLAGVVRKAGIDVLADDIRFLIQRLYFRPPGEIRSALGTYESVWRRAMVGEFRNEVHRTNVGRRAANTYLREAAANAFSGQIQPEGADTAAGQIGTGGKLDDLERHRGLIAGDRRG